MTNTNRLIEVARRWRKAVAVGRRRLSLVTTADTTPTVDVSSTSTVAGKGHFAVYTSDRKRFEVPLAYLSTNIFKELLRLAEDEYGLPSDGPITLACDGGFMEYVLLLLKKRVPKDTETAVLVSIVSGRCTSSFLPPAESCSSRQQFVLYGF